MSVIQSTAVAENAKKKTRAPQDPTAEWTSTICRVLAHKLGVIRRDLKNSDFENICNHWDYLYTLLVAMYDIHMADHWEVIVWLVKMAEESYKQLRSKSSSAATSLNCSPQVCSANGDFVLQFILHYLIRFGYRFTESELLTRRLLHWCCMVFAETFVVGSKQSFNASSLQAILKEYKDVCECPLHRNICMSLSSLIIFLTLSSPSAAVWNPLPIETEHAYLKGSPLDFLPHTLLALPLPWSDEFSAIRNCLFDVEESIIVRGRSAETGWVRLSAVAHKGESVDHLVRMLDIMDRHEYHLVREHNPMESLFNRIFNDDTIHSDTEAIVSTLCEWAVSSYRIGIYRSIVVACLLEQLAISLSHNLIGRQRLQESLINFLDSYTIYLPVFNGEQSMVENELMRNLVCLFSELIDREVFDHDNYVRHFIARGVFDTSYHPLASGTGSSTNHNVNSAINMNTSRMNTPTNNQRPTNYSLTNSLQNNTQHSVKSEISEELDRCSMDNPDSVRSEVGTPQFAVTQRPITTQSNHLHYLIQFPIPQDESYIHEQNQRFQLLYGSVRARDRARYRIRKLVRDICKLFTKKNYLIDVVHGEVCRRKKSKERDREKDVNLNVIPVTNTNGAPPNANCTSLANNSGNTGISGNGHRANDEAHSIDELHEGIMQRFMRLSFYDMECVLSQCTPVFVKMLSGSNGHSGCGASSEDAVNSSTLTNTTTSSVIINNNLIGMSNSPSALSSFNTSHNGASLSLNQSHIYMPVPSSIFLFFDLIETSLNITCLLLTVIDTLERLRVLFETRTHFMTLYMSYLCLRSVGILQRYQAVLFTMGDNISNRLFPTLIEQVRQVKEPTQCGPFERCILTYLNDLFTSNYVIKTRFTSIYVKAHQKVSVLFRPVDPSEGKAQFDSEYATDLLMTASTDNLSTFRAYTEDLRTNPSSRYSFVCKAITWICQAKTIERVNYLCGLCAELTSQCSELTPEWLGSFYAILAPRPYSHGYTHLVSVIDPGQVSIHDNLSSLIGTLLSRYCFTISDFLRLVICPAMAQGLDDVTKPIGPQLEPIISLACHILHRLFTAESTVSSLQSSGNVLTPNPEVNSAHNSSADNSTSPQFRISEPLLLTAALQKVTPEFLVDVLKMLIVHSDKASLESDSRRVSESGNDVADTDDDQSLNDHDDTLTDADTEDEEESYHNVNRKRPKSNLQDDTSSTKRKRRRLHNRKNLPQVHSVVQRFLEQGILPYTTELHALPLSALTQLVLREICTVSWVRERFQQMAPNHLVRENVLIDKNFSQSQARRLLHIIYWPYDLSWADVASTSEGLAGAMCHVLSDLNMWSLRCAQMEFQLLYAQISFSQQSEILGYLAQSIVQGFQTQATNWLNSNGYGLFSESSFGSTGGLPNFALDHNDPAWLLPTLIAKLPKTLKVQLVKVTSETLKGIRNFWKHKNDEDKESVLLQNSIILAHPAFFALLQVCLQECDPIDSLYEQIEYFVQNAKETEDRVPDNLRTRQIVQECLRLRLSLVGQKFRAIQIDPDICTRWSILLAQLIGHGVIEPESNRSLFYVVFDMLQTLIHTLASRTGLEGKHYQNVAKKIRRELAERPPNSGIECIKPLLLLTKNSYTVFVTGHSRHRTGTSGATGGSLGGSSVGGSVGKLGNSGKAGSKGSGKAGGGSNYLNSSGSTSNCMGKLQFKKRGYHILGKERLAPWDILDPGKHYMLLSMYGVLRTEAVLLRIEEQANRLIRHEHYEKMYRSAEFYLKPVFTDDETSSHQNDQIVAAKTLHSESATMNTASVTGLKSNLAIEHTSTLENPGVTHTGLYTNQELSECANQFSQNSHERHGHLSNVSSSDTSSLQSTAPTTSLGGGTNNVNYSNGLCKKSNQIVSRELDFNPISVNLASVNRTTLNRQSNNLSNSKSMDVHNFPNEVTNNLIAHNQVTNANTTAQKAQFISDPFRSTNAQSLPNNDLPQHSVNLLGVHLNVNQNDMLTPEIDLGKFTTKYSDSVNKSSEFSSRVVPPQMTTFGAISSTPTTSTSTTTKRKRGSGRRGGNSATSSQRGNSRNATAVHLNADRPNVQLNPYLYSSNGDKDGNWNSKHNAYNMNVAEASHPSAPSSRGQGYLASLSGFLRSRAQQHSTITANHQLPHQQPYTNVMTQHHSHSFDETQVSTQFNHPHVLENTGESVRRHLPSGNPVHRVISQSSHQIPGHSGMLHNVNVASHQQQLPQTVPNPPPYPVLSHSFQIQQPSFRVPPDDSYMMLTNDSNIEEQFKRNTNNATTLGSSIPHLNPRSQTYDNFSSQFSNEGHVLYMPNVNNDPQTRMIAHPLHSQLTTKPDQVPDSHYSRYSNY